MKVSGPLNDLFSQVVINLKNGTARAYEFAKASFCFSCIEPNMKSNQI